MAAVTPGQASVHATATEATVAPCRSAIGRRASRSSRLRLRRRLAEVGGPAAPVVLGHARDSLGAEGVREDAVLHGAVAEHAGAVLTGPRQQFLGRLPADKRRTAAGASRRGRAPRSARGVPRRSWRRRRPPSVPPPSASASPATRAPRGCPDRPASGSGRGRRARDRGVAATASIPRRMVWGVASCRSAPSGSASSHSRPHLVKTRGRQGAGRARNARPTTSSLCPRP